MMEQILPARKGKLIIEKSSLSHLSTEACHTPDEKLIKVKSLKIYFCGPLNGKLSSIDVLDIVSKHL